MDNPEVRRHLLVCAACSTGCIFALVALIVVAMIVPLSSQKVILIILLCAGVAMLLTTAILSGLSAWAVARARSYMEFKSGDRA